MRRYVAVIAVLAFLAGLPAGKADARQVHWHQSGASVYGGACEAGWLGYKGDFLPDLPHSVAQLDSGGFPAAPYKAKVRVLYRGRKMTFRKRDIGGGGAPVKGRKRLWDFWEAGLTRLLGHRNCNWTDVVHWRYIR